MVRVDGVRARCNDGSAAALDEDRQRGADGADGSHQDVLERFVPHRVGRRIGRAVRGQTRSGRHGDTGERAEPANCLLDQALRLTLAGDVSH